MRRTRESPAIATLLLVPQFIIWALFAFVPVTVKGEPGIDVSIALLMVFVSGVLLLVSLVASFRARSFGAFALQISLPALVFLGHYAVHAWRMPPHRDAADFQHLVGVSRAEVEAEFGTYGSQVTTVHRGGDAVHEVHLYYPGLKLVVDRAGRVTAVESR